MNSPENYQEMDGIAIIGMSGEFPGAKNLEQFWQNLRDGVESISLFSKEELLESGIDACLLEDPNYVKAKGFIEDIELFDAAFFGYNPREAETIDPQHRRFLQCAWEALEVAGYNSETYAGRIGVMAGVGSNSYFLYNICSNGNFIDASGVEDRTLLGNEKDYLTTRVSYKLNLKGPSIDVQSACSTSLVATSLACQSLLSYQCDMALAGGVTISVPKKSGYLYQKGGILSPDGHCRAFDAAAAGTTIGNGVGIVVLKRLEDAIADGDTIHAVIKSSAINNDGAVKAGFTAPSISGQAEAIAEAIGLAGISPETIAYVETHGTGTALGDPIEIKALTKAFSHYTQKKGFCAIGSVKTNIGHVDAAAGVAGLIKTVLALKNRLIPPSLHFETPNREIDFAKSPFYVNTQLTEWKKGKNPRRAAVSSMGIGGTNAHAILEEAPEIEASSASRLWQLLLISAKTESALENATANLAEYFKQHPDLNLADAAHTLQVGRRAFTHRRMLVCQHIEDAVNVLLLPSPCSWWVGGEVKSNQNQRVFTQVQEPHDRSIAFAFPGQGSQYVNMGRELYKTEAIFREIIVRCCSIIQPHIGLDLRSLLYPDDWEIPRATEKLKQTNFAQPALFIIEYAIAQLWMSWGIVPAAAIGHSIGEYVAACLAEVISLEDALALVAIRGKLMRSLPSGAMLAVSLPSEQVKLLLNENLSLAANNAPESCVVSGLTEAIDELQTQLAAKGIETRRLHTSHAFHSQMMEPILPAFIEAVKKVKLHPPKIAFISNVTGTWITASEATDPNYWAQHLRQTVRFVEGISQLLQDANRILLEVGPGRTLSTFAAKLKTHREIIVSLRHPQDEQSDVAFLLNALGRLWLAGVCINWSGFYAEERRYRIPLPTYPFDRQRYWIEPQKQSDRKKPNIADWFYLPVWKQAPNYSESQHRNCWLIFADDSGIGLEIARRLQGEGCDAIAVRAGAKFAKCDRNTYTINVQQSEDYITLLEDLRLQGRIPNAIAHLWSVTPSDSTESGIEDFDKFQNVAFGSLLFLIQAIEKQNINDPINLFVVTNDLYDVTGAENLRPEKATVLGLCKVIPLEFPNITCRNIDIAFSTSCIYPDTILTSPPTPPLRGEGSISPPFPCREGGLGGLGLPHRRPIAFPHTQLIEQLTAEFTRKTSDEMVAYRGRHRWVQTFESLPIEEKINRTKLREKGVYLITGGLGGIGLELAEYLAQTVRAKLILIGRSAFPEKQAWDEWLATRDSDDAVSRKIEKLRSLEALGAEVLVQCADATDLQQMQAAIAASEKQFGSISGVIHAAGIKLDSTLQSLSRNDGDLQLKANGRGLFVLEKVLQGKALDFCLVISSLSSILGVLGMAAYPSAHCFADAFVSDRAQKNSLPWMSVNLDNWITSQAADEFANIPDRSLELMMSASEGVEVFKRIFSLEKISQITISTVDLQARIQQWIKGEFLKARVEDNRYPSVYARPNLRNAYIAPETENEQKLAKIWQEVLGVDRVGISDNFFELGGDSILSIQIIAKANQASLRFTYKQLFENQTIAELAALAQNKAVFAEQGLVGGEVPLTPIQHWFFEQNFASPQHWNQAILLEMPSTLEPAILQQAVQQLLKHHDALRLRFAIAESGWKQFIAEPDETVPFAIADLSLLSPDERESAFETAVTEWQASLNLSKGPIVRAVLFDFGKDSPRRLLIAIHHLAVDINSWRILIEDLQAIYQQLSRGETIHLPPKTTSYKQWAQRLIEWVNKPHPLTPFPAREGGIDSPPLAGEGVGERSLELQQQLDYWLTASRENIAPLPVDYPEGVNNVASARTISAMLSVEETQTLLQEVSAAYRAQIDDILLAALVQAFSKWTKQHSLLVDLEGNGRDILFEDVELSRTVGWFTAIAPALLEVEEMCYPGEALKTVKEQLRRFPDRGLGFGALLYLTDDREIQEKLRSLPRSEILFLYLGEIDRSLNLSSLFQLSDKFSGHSHSLRALRSHIFEINASVEQKKLKVDFTYSENLHRQETVEKLAQDLIEALRSLLSNDQNSQPETYTAADFAEFQWSQWNQSDLDNIMAAVNQAQEV